VGVGCPPEKCLMNEIAEHARSICDHLSQSLAVLETQSQAIAFDVACHAIRDAWLSVVDDYENGEADLSSAYLATAYDRLAAAAGLENPGTFAEHGLQILSAGSRESWTRFAKSFHYDDAENSMEEEYALAQLRWGEHVSAFALTLGWFAMNVVRLRRGQEAIYPPIADHERMLRFLQYAGPDDYDAEAGLRGLALEYAKRNRTDGPAAE
jgi:hypothetical protein